MTQETGQNKFDTIAALIAAEVTPEKLKKYADNVLEKTLDNYNIQTAVMGIVQPLVVEECKRVIVEDPQFKAMLRGATLKQLVSAVDVCNARLCAMITAFLNDSTKTK
jgi:hypothetical protein